MVDAAYRCAASAANQITQACRYKRSARRFNKLHTVGSWYALCALKTPVLVRPCQASARPSREHAATHDSSVLLSII